MLGDKIEPPGDGTETKSPGWNEMKHIRAHMIAIAVMILAGCGAPKAEIQSDTSWSGSFGDRRVDGSGNATVGVGGPSPYCAIVQKRTAEGILRVRIVSDDPTGPSTDWSETTLPFGVTSSCLEQTTSSAARVARGAPSDGG